MSNSYDFGTDTHRERGRGRKAFWIVVGALVVAWGGYAFWAAPRAALRVSSSHTVLDATAEIWPELTPEQREAVLRHWERRAEQ